MRAKTWLYGSTDIATSSGPSTIASVETRVFRTRFCWLSITPLGFPVVPEV